MFSISGMAQSFVVAYDHTAFRVTDADVSAAFYQKVFQLEEIETPASGSTLRWFSLGGDDQLHLIKGDTKDIKLHKGVHIAFNIAEYDAFLAHIDELGINYTNWMGDAKAPGLRGDGIRQIYIQDPDGYWIEVNDARY
jgi:catechol 2,3-dioxygenase-like lactoylglutathione lyase family enzyme